MKVVGATLLAILLFAVAFHFLYGRDAHFTLFAVVASTMGFAAVIFFLPDTDAQRSAREAQTLAIIGRTLAYTALALTALYFWHGTAAFAKL